MLVQLIHFSSEINICNSTNTHKSGGVVIPDGLGITKGLQSRVSLNDLILQGTLILSNTETTAGSVPSIYD